MFWSIWAYDRELVFPKSNDDIIPIWQNHVLHSLPLFTAIFDNFLFYHPYPNFLNGIWLTILFFSLYLGW